jgi:hypothetical protein
MTGEAANPREAAAKPSKRRRFALTMFNTRQRPWQNPKADSQGSFAT